MALQNFRDSLLCVSFNQDVTLVICLEEALYIHNIKDMKILKSVLNTAPNPKEYGDMISAHASPVAAISFNSSGTNLASASEKGTVIRVFSVLEGVKLFEFRRGMKRYVSISSLSFSAYRQFLCASSNTETVHIFKLEPHSPRFFESDNENPRVSDLEVGSPSYASTVATTSSLDSPSSSSLTGYSEDGGANKGELIPEHEFADGPVRLDDGQEFPPVNFQNT